MKKLFFVPVIIVLLSCSFLSVSCRSAKRNAATKQVLRGMIYDWDNTPVGSAELTLTNPENSRFSKTVLSDMTGRFDFGEVYPGSYVLSGSVQGYEDISESFTFTDARQILYIRTASGTQLLEKAYEALAENKFDEAASFIRRASALDFSDRRALFYEALLNFEKGNIEESLRILFALEKKDASDAAVLLFIADIYLYEKNDSFTALRYLKKAALFSDSSAVSERIRMIEEKEKTEKGDIK